MTLPLQAVDDQATDQNFRQVAERFPLQAEDLGKSAKEMFPQLATPGVHKEASGTAEVEWSGGTNASKFVEVTHGLGAEAAGVTFGVRVNGVGAFPEWENVSATKFKVRLQCPFGAPVLGTKAEFSWRALT